MNFTKHQPDIHRREEAASIQDAIDVDAMMDAFESDIAQRGVAQVDVRVHADAALKHADSLRASNAIVELLRVWMEHRWNHRLPVTLSTCQSLFPEVRFTPEQLEVLRFEEERLRANSISRKTSAHDYPSLDRLPRLGARWCEFELLELLGEGAFARVYLARQTTMADRLVVLKLTFRKTSESRWLAKLQHSAIVPIYSVHQAESVFGICMPYLGNTTLADILNEAPVASSMVRQKTSRTKSHSGKELLSTLAARNQRLTTITDSITASQVGIRGEEVRQPLESGLSNRPSHDALQRRESSEPVSTRVSNAWQSTLTVQSPVSRLLSKYDYVQSMLWIFAQLADALDCAHRLGVLHSDIKPANVLLAADGQPRLLDFNVSQFHDPSSQHDSTDSAPAQPLGGTLAYMSPEHLRALSDATIPIDPRSDIYSLGLVLYQMLAGALPKQVQATKPFVHDPKNANLESRSQQVASKPSTATSVDLSPLPAEVTPAVAAILSRCLQADPARRYQRASELFDDLMAQLEDRPLVHQPEPSWRERLAKWSRRHPRLSSSTTLGAIASVLLIALVGTLFLRGQQLRTAESSNRVARFELQQPEVISYLSALDLAPELVGDAQQKVDQLLSLIVSGHSPKRIDEDWIRSLPEDQQKKLRAQLRQLASLSQLPNVAPLQVIQADLVKGLQALTDAQDQSDAVDSVQQANHADFDLYLRGDYASASHEFEARVQAAQQDYASWLMLGNCYAGLQNYAAAQQCYTACMALRPNIPVPQFFRGIARLQAGEHAGAIADFTAITEKNPRWTSAHFNRALAEKALGDLTQALQSLNATVDHGDRSVQTLAMRAEVNGLLGRAQQQQEDIAQALAAKPVSEEDFVVHALLQLDAGNTQAAVEELQATTKKFPQSLDARQNLGHIYADVLNDSQMALEEMNVLIEADPQNPTRLAGRAVIHARAGRIDQAIKDLDRSVACQPQIPLIQYQIASGYSLIAANLSQNEDTPAKQIDAVKLAAQKWFAKAVVRDPSLMPIIETDQDFAWFRQQPEYRSICNALQVLELAEADSISNDTTDQP